MKKIIVILLMCISFLNSCNSNRNVNENIDPHTDYNCCGTQDIILSKWHEDKIAVGCGICGRLMAIEEKPQPETKVVYSASCSHCTMCYEISPGGIITIECGDCGLQAEIEITYKEMM